MPIPQQTPGGGPEGTATQFRYVGTDCGTRWTAYVAGKCHWFKCHTRGRTKPCLHVMTDGYLACTRCDPERPAVDVGYLPLYREVDLRPVMVLVYVDQLDSVNALKLHQRVTIGRENQQSDSTWVGPAMTKGAMFYSTLRERYRDADLTQTLLKLWGIPELVAWYNTTHGAGQKPMKPAATTTEEAPKKKKREEVSPMMRAAFDRVGLLGEQSLLPGQEETAEALALRRIQEQQDAHRANGKPKPR